MKHHHVHTKTGIQAERREATTISNCVVSNIDAPLGVADDEAAIVAFGWADVQIKDVLTHNSQRALLTYDHRVNTFDNGKAVPKKNVDVHGLFVYGFENINKHPNKGEMLIIHGWPAHKFPDASGYGKVTLHTIGGVNNSLWLSVWKAEIDELLIHDANVRAIDIGVQRPIRKMYISDLTAERVIIRMMDGFQVDHIGDWHLDDKYVYELHDQRNGERFPNETYVGEFDTPEEIRKHVKTKLYTKHQKTDKMYMNKPTKKIVYDGIMGKHPDLGLPRAGMLHPNDLWGDDEDRQQPPDWEALKSRLAVVFEKQPDLHWYTNIEHLLLPNPWVKNRPDPDSERAQLSREIIRGFGECVQEMVGERYIGNYGGIAALGLNRYAGGLEKVVTAWDSWLTDNSKTSPLEITGVGVQSHYYRHTSRSVWAANTVMTADWWREKLPDVKWTAFVSPWNYQKDEPLDVRTFTLCFVNAKALYDYVVIWDHPDREWDDIEEHVEAIQENLT